MVNILKTDENSGDIDWDYYNRIDKNPGRPSTPWQYKWVNKMRAAAWYAFLESSEFEFHKVDLSFQTSEEIDGNKIKKTYSAIDRQWRHWRDGISRIKDEVLTEIDKYVPGSHEVYAVGPDGNRLWLTYYPNTNIMSEFLISNPFPVDSNYMQIDPLSNDKYHNLYQDDLPIMEELDPDEYTTIELSGFGTNVCTNSIWYKITRSIQAFMIRNANSSNVILDTDHELFFDVVQTSKNNAKNYMLKLLKEHEDEINKFDLNPTDFIYPFMRSLTFQDPRDINHDEYSFRERYKNPVWKELSLLFDKI